MQFCRFCGTKLPADALFCASCGRQLNIDANQPTNISAGLPPAPPRPLSTRTLSQPPQEPQNERRDFALPIPPPAAAPGNLPIAAGTPQIGTVPSVVGTVVKATAFTATTAFKIVAVTLVCAVLVVAGVKVLPPIITHGGSSTPTPNPIGQRTPVTVQMPPTQTSCPPSGQARAAVTANLVLGKDQNIVYAENASNSNNTPISGTLYRYDVATGKTAQMLKQNNANITDAQISADGQWVLFVSSVNGQAAIQMIRMDAQGLQTLYCAPASRPVANVYWSPDQKMLVFEGGGSNGTFNYQTHGLDGYAPPNIYLLNLSSGFLQIELTQPDSSQSSSPRGYSVRQWLDNTRVYIVGTTMPNQDYGPTPWNIYLLDLSKGAKQSPQELQQVVSISSFVHPGAGDGPWRFGKTPDGKQLAISQCFACTTGGYVGNASNPSTITVQSITPAGNVGPQHTIFSSPSDQLGTIAVISNQTLLFTIENTTYRDTTPDITRNGLWKVNLDGSGLTHLAMITGGLYTDAGGIQQSSWVAVSRDGGMYASSTEITSTDYSGVNDSLFFGSLSGGTPTTFLSKRFASQKGILSYGNITIVGWTIM